VVRILFPEETAKYDQHEERDREQTKAEEQRPGGEQRSQGSDPQQVEAGIRVQRVSFAHEKTDLDERD